MERIFMRRISVALFLTALLAIDTGFTDAGERQEPTPPLFLKLPFDRVTLTSHFGGGMFDVKPIDFDEGHRPDPLRKTGELTVRFADNPLKEYTIRWSAIESIELFCELVFKEFRQRLEAVTTNTRSLVPEDADWSSLSVSYEQLYDYLVYLDDFKTELPQLPALYETFLFEEATYRVRSGNYPTGLSRYELLFRRNKDYPDLSKAWGEALGLMLEALNREGEFVKARKQLFQFKKFCPDHSVVKEWEERIRQAARDRFDRSREAAAAKNFLLAHFLCEEADNIEPTLDGLGAWQQQLQRDAPRINAAVQNSTDAARLADWGTIRRRRLLQRTLSEYIRPSVEGGVYASPFGKLDKTDRNQTLRWKISPNLHWTERPEPINAFTVADSLLRLAKPVPPGNGSRTLWNELLASVDITSSDELVVRLSRSHLLPEALFEIAVQPSTRFAVPGASTSESSEAFTGPFVPGTPYDAKYEPFQRTGFQRNTDTDSASAPKVLVEYTVDRSEDAVNLLLNGTVDVIDRVAPWELERLQRNPSLTTGRYAVPTLCFLVPNFRKPLPGNRTFRRALLYGLNRERMLAKFSSKGVDATIAGGPFIKGASLGDPLGYAYDTSIAPRPYEPKLAIALALLALGQTNEKYRELLGKSKFPEIVLARPVHETALFAGLMIRRQWEAIGVPVREVDFRADEQIGQGTDVDFWFVERTVKEPLVDAEALFGRNGLLGGGSSYMELALEKLRRAEDWPTAAKRLQEIHRLCFEETTLLPLWQISEHFVHRAEISGIRTMPPILDLYQNVEHWNDTR